MYPQCTYDRGATSRYPERCYRQAVGAVKIFFPKWRTMRGVRVRVPGAGKWSQWLPACADHFHARDWYLDHNGLTLAMRRGTLRAWMIQRARKIRRTFPAPLVPPT